MKIINLVEFLREELLIKRENGVSGDVVNGFTGPVCTATPEEAEKIAQYLIEGLYANADESKKKWQDDDILAEIAFSHYKDGRIEAGHIYGGTSSSFWLPPKIDENSWGNIITAINATGVFQIEQLDNKLFGVIEDRFHTTYAKLSSYINNLYTQSETQKKLS